MSLRAAPRAPIPAETVRVAHAAFPKGTMCMQMRDTLGPIYDDDQFATLFSSTGQPAEAPARVLRPENLLFSIATTASTASDALAAW